MTRLGDDDMFSSDLSIDEYKSLYGGISPHLHLMLLFSEKDEYVPPYVNVEQNILVKIAQTCPAFRFARIIRNADHAINGRDQQLELCELVDAFILQL
jgi:hypothetical protein